jgi:hypothetical protein
MMKNSLPLSLSRSSSPPDLKETVGMYNDYGSHLLLELLYLFVQTSIHNNRT